MTTLGKSARSLDHARIAIVSATKPFSRYRRTAPDGPSSQELLPEVFKSPSYFADSCGGAPIEIIKQYIDQQKTPL